MSRSASQGRQPGKTSRRSTSDADAAILFTRGIAPIN
jgi:hypothetical protein